MDEFLRQAMRDRQWSIPRLAEECDVNPGLVARWVSRNPRYRVTPSPASCEKIAEALGVDVDYVLELAGHRKPRQPFERVGVPLPGLRATRWASALRLWFDEIPRLAVERVCQLSDSVWPSLTASLEPND